MDDSVWRKEPDTFDGKQMSIFTHHRVTIVNFFEFKIDSDTNRHSLLPSSDSSRLHPLDDINTTLYTTKDNPQPFVSQCQNELFVLFTVLLLIIIHACIQNSCFERLIRDAGACIGASPTSA